MQRLRVIMAFIQLFALLGGCLLCINLAGCAAPGASPVEKQATATENEKRLAMLRSLKLYNTTIDSYDAAMSSMIDTDFKGTSDLIEQVYVDQTFGGKDGYKAKILWAKRSGVKVCLLEFGPSFKPGLLISVDWYGGFRPGKE